MLAADPEAHEITSDF